MRLIEDSALSSSFGCAYILGNANGLLSKFRLRQPKPLTKRGYLLLSESGFGRIHTEEEDSWPTNRTSTLFPYYETYIVQDIYWLLCDFADMGVAIF